MGDDADVETQIVKTRSRLERRATTAVYLSTARQQHKPCNEAAAEWRAAAAELLVVVVETGVAARAVTRIKCGAAGGGGALVACRHRHITPTDRSGAPQTAGAVFTISIILSGVLIIGFK